MEELKNYSMVQKVDFQLQIETDTSNEVGIVLNYIERGDHPDFSAREMVLKAVKAFWLPYVYYDKHLSSVSIHLYKHIAREAVARLKEQIREIERIFKLES